jgi:hypothetical protein
VGHLFGTNALQRVLNVMQSALPWLDHHVNDDVRVNAVPTAGAFG